MKKYLIIGGFWLMASLLILPFIGSAANLNAGVNALTETGLGTRDLKDTITSVINIVLGFLAIVATVAILVAGFKWMTAGGNEEKIESAKKLLTGAIIGLVIVLISYAVARFVISALINET